LVSEGTAHGGAAPLTQKSRAGEGETGAAL